MQQRVAGISAITADAARVIADSLPVLQIGAVKNKAGSLPARSEAALADFFSSYQEEISKTAYGRSIQKIQIHQIPDIVSQVWSYGSLQQLMHKLVLLDMLSLLPNQHSCSKTSCTNLDGDSERDLVRGKRSVCGRCRTAHYCSKRCQQAHWKFHRAQCAKIAAAAASAAAVARTREA